MRRFLIVGGGQAGLQLALCLQRDGHDVTLVVARTADEVANGWPTSTQVMFGPALDLERAHGLNLWDDEAPAIAGIDLGVAAPDGARPALRFVAPLAQPARSVDQRVKMAAWQRLFEDRARKGRPGRVLVRAAGAADVREWAGSGRYDLVVVAAGRSGLTGLFDVREDLSPNKEPRRALAVAYVHGVAPDPAGEPLPHLVNGLVPGVGDLFVIPGLTAEGTADILFWEAQPGGPADRFQPGGTRLAPEQVLHGMLELAERYLPWVYERCRRVRLAGPRPTVVGRFRPVVREPLADLGGVPVLALGDAAVSNDPIVGQGANLACRHAEAVYRAIRARDDDRPFDEAFVRDTFAAFWAAIGEATTRFCTLALGPGGDDLRATLTAAATRPEVARRFAHGFADPASLTSWLLTPGATRDYLNGLAAGA